jgi:GTP-binding protein Era
MNKFKSGFVVIVGKPNVGKSTLINLILKEKLSIVTPKPQTTRQSIKGIYTDEQRQIIFLDTPGFLQPKYLLQEKMMEYLLSSLKDADLIVFITDVKTFPTEYDEQLLEIIKKSNTPKIAILNKTDLANQTEVTEKQIMLSEYGFDKIFTSSFITYFDKDLFLDTITQYLPENPPFYDPDTVSDQGMKFFVQEIIREKIFLNFSQEIPYSTTVTVEQYKEYDNKVEILANIWLERQSQKPIIIGRNGEMIKKIRVQSEKEIHAIVGKRVKLQLWVKIKKNWRKKKNALKEFGYK